MSTPIDPAKLNQETLRLVRRLREIADNKTGSPEVIVLAESMLQLYQLVAGLRTTGLEAFEQIQELDRRQGPGDE
jgi:hypothetical protein